jgi:GTP-binding protein
MPNIVFYKPVFSAGDYPALGLPEICISGRSNVGKSSLINSLANNYKLAKVSQTPGKTRSLNYYLVDGKFFFVDLPGYGYAKIPQTERMLFEKLVTPYLTERKELKGIIQLFDSRHGPIAGDNVMLDWESGFKGKILYAFTKADKLSVNILSVFKKKYENEFGKDNIVFCSAKVSRGIDDIMNWAYKTADG